MIEYSVGGVVSYETFNFVDAASQSWTVPAGVDVVRFTTYGAGGGGTNISPVRTRTTNADSWYAGQTGVGTGEGTIPVVRDGGAGGSATGTFVVNVGEEFTINVGQGGIGNPDARCLPTVTAPDPINQSWVDIAPRDTNLNAARASFGGGALAKSHYNTRALWSFPLSQDYPNKDFDECINPYFASGGGRSEVLRSETRLVAAGGGGGAGFYGDGGAGGALLSGLSAAGADGAGPVSCCDHQTLASVSRTYGSGGTGSAGGLAGLTSRPTDLWTTTHRNGAVDFAGFALPRVDGAPGVAGTGGFSVEGGGGGGGGCFGGGGGGDGGGGGGGSSCIIGSVVSKFMTTSPDGTYAAGDQIDVTAIMSKPIADGAELTVTLDTGEVVLLTKVGPYTMSGTYVVGATASTTGLDVVGFALSSSLVDVDGVTMTSTTIPSGTNNIAGSSAIVIGDQGAAGGPVTGGPVLVCRPAELAVGTTVTCEVTGGDADIDIWWRALAGASLHASGPVRLGPDGTGVFSFTVLSSAVGRELSVELVEWVGPHRLGTVGGPVPSSVPTGDAPLGWNTMLVLMVGLALMVAWPSLVRGQWR